ncbi:hypothetical protein N7520_011600 [Penicillium odoratum]|uniref:uncharacterized protein n=1 Tax=Penicillium odoratum TaxID=1167516 RepID=UPI0025499A1A|nr:uncharacterized protein N7520_011600 [Penicillium odoratum]KAJ5746418.1 hypothetical protein N7520_011600 [Penicillium odoratum]
MDALSGVASVIGVIQLAGSVIEICGGYLRNVKNAKDDILRLQQDVISLSEILSTLHDLLRGLDGPKLTTTQNLSHNLMGCESALTNLKEKLSVQSTQNPMRRWGLRALKWPLKRSEVDDAAHQIERYKTLFSLALDIDQMKATDLIDQKIDLGRPRIAKGAEFDSYDNDHIDCLPGTQTELLQGIEDWASSSDGKCIFWLRVMAGTGNSTISRTAARRLKVKNALDASFFFKRGEGDRGNAKCLFPTLIDQLVRTNPRFVPAVREAVEDDPNISNKVLREQFEKLILKPLLTIQLKQVISTVVIIDALDECDKEDDIRAILQLLPQVREAKSVQLRFLLTSRPESGIRRGFQGIAENHQDLILHEIPQPVIEHDIMLYLQYQLSMIREERSLPSSWPGDEAINILAEGAVPLFISAATICRFIGDENWNPEVRLQVILADQANYVSKMDSTYMPVLNQLLAGQDEWESQQLAREFKEIVGVIILLAAPLTVHALSRLLDLEEATVNNRLNRLHSVLDIPANVGVPVRLLHLSFRDFLLDHKKKNSPFWVDEKENHQKIATHSLVLMQKSLRRNICNLSFEGITRQEITQQTIDQYLPPELQYACRNWTQHLKKSQDSTKLDKTLRFLNQHFLQWMEVLSILGMVSEVIEAINRLQSGIKDDGLPQLAAFRNDARRFILQIGRLLRLHHFGSTVQGLYLLHYSQFQWSALQQTLEGHNAPVNAVVFSPDGKLLASASDDIMLRETATGALQQTLGHSGQVISVAFSPDGRLLASVSFPLEYLEKKTINLWETATGVLKHRIKVNEDAQLMVFSSDRRISVSASDKTIKLWETAIGTLQHTIEAREDDVQSVAISPNELVLTSASWAIELWTQEFTLYRHDSFINSIAIALSPNGQLLASASHDHKIRLWETATGALQPTLKRPRAGGHLVAFSPDGKLLASASLNGTVGLWETATGVLQQTLEGHSEEVNSVAFSPDGQLLASASRDHTIKI